MARKRRFAKSAEVHARELGISESQARRYLLEGMPEKEPLRSEWVAARAAEARSGGASDDQVTQLQVAKLMQQVKRLINQNALLELQKSKIAGEMVEMTEVKRQLASLATAVRNGVMAIPGRLADRVVLAANAAAAEELMREECEAVLRVLADGSSSGS